MYFLIKTNNNISEVVSKAEDTSLSNFKLNNPAGATADGTWEYFEIPNSVYGSLQQGITASGLYSIDGTTAGLYGITAPSAGAATASYLYNDTSSLNMQEISTDVALIRGQLPSDYATTALDIGVYDAQQNFSGKIEIDPRLHPDITLAQVQTVKETESENSFLDEGLGATAAISFEMDDGSAKTLTFDNRHDTILDLMMIKQYSDLNQSIVSAGSQTSVSVTGIQLLDYTGTVTELSPTEYDKFMHSLLASFYENYLSHINMKNVIKNPVGSTDAQKISYLLDNTNVSFSTSAGSSFTSSSSGK